MSHTDFLSAINSSDHEFIAALRYLDDYGKQAYQRQFHQSYHHFVPKFNLEQHADTYELYGELPGFRREDILIEAHDDHNLQISGSIAPLSAQGHVPEPAAPPIHVPVSAGTREQTNGAGSKTESAKDDVSPKAATPQEPLTNGKAFTPAPTAHGVKVQTTNQERYLNSRFGDVLDPNAHGDDDYTDSANFGRVRYLLAERHPSAFHREFHFPSPIRRGEITASVQDGVLHVTAPRAKVTEPPRRVPVWRGERSDDEEVYNSRYPVV